MAAEAFVSALLTDKLSDASNKEAIYRLVSHARAEHKVRGVLPLALGEPLSKSLSRSYVEKVGRVRNEFAHGKRPGTPVAEALRALKILLVLYSVGAAEIGPSLAYVSAPLLPTLRAPPGDGATLLADFLHGEVGQLTWPGRWGAQGSR